MPEYIATPSGTSPEGNGVQTILIIDDDRRFAQSMKALIEIAGYGTAVAFGAPEAIRRLVSGRLHAVVLDLLIPGVDGFQIMDHIRYSWPHLPVIIISGDSRPEAKKRAMELGAYAFFTKPIEHEPFLDLLKKVVSENHRGTGRKVPAPINQTPDALYRSAFDAMKEAVHMVDQDLNLVMTNTAFANWIHEMGLDPQMEGRSLLEIFPYLPGQIARIQNEYAEVLSSGKSAISEEVYRVWGQDMIAELQKIPVRTARDDRYVLTVIRDITLRKRTEEALSESEEKYRILVDSATDAIFIIQDGAVTFPNPMVESLTGFTKQELDNCGFSDLIHPDDCRSVLESIAQAATDPPKSIQPPYFRILNKSGHILWVQLNLAPITWEGEPALLAILRDITQQKAMESKILHAQKMDAITTLAGGIAHQFNNALSSITGNLELIKLFYPDDAQIIKFMKRMFDSGQKMADLINQLLAYAEGGKYSATRTSLNRIVQETLPLIVHAFDRRIQIETRLDEELPKVRADVNQIQMVISSLMSNAEEAMDGEGRITVRTETAVLGPNARPDFPDLPPGCYAILTVEDTGAGMDEETLGRIFEPFFTTKFQGRGLGMSAVYGIIKNHEGAVKVSSEAGKGTRVHILLPAVENDAPTTDTA